MAAEIELKKINEYVQSLVAITNVTGAYVYGIDANGNSIKIEVSKIAAGGDYSHILELCNQNAQNIQTLQSALASQGVKTVTLTQAQYDALEVYDKDTLYLIKESWTFANGGDVDDALSLDSENPVQNKVLTAAINRFLSFLDTTDAADATINKWRELNAFLDGITDQQTLAGLLDAVRSELRGEISAKQDKFTFDTTPTADSANPVTSGGVKAAIDAIQTTDVNVTQIQASGTEIARINGTSIYAPAAGLTSSGLQQIEDMADYDGALGDIVQYVGDSTENYTHGYIYQRGNGRTYPAYTKYCEVPENDYGIIPGTYYKTGEAVSSQWYRLKGSSSSTKTVAYIYESPSGDAIKVLESGFTGAVAYGQYWGDAELCFYVGTATTNAVVTIPAWQRIDVQPATDVSGLDTRLSAVEARLRFVTATSISHNLANIDTASLTANDIVIVTDIVSGTPLTYTINNEAKTLYGNPDFDVPFRYAGAAGFKPIAFPFLF